MYYFVYICISSASSDTLVYSAYRVGNKAYCGWHCGMSFGTRLCQPDGMKITFSESFNLIEKVLGLKSIRVSAVCAISFGFFFAVDAEPLSALGGVN